jgi:hypothetical protein
MQGEAGIQGDPGTSFPQTFTAAAFVRQQGSGSTEIPLLAGAYQAEVTAGAYGPVGLRSQAYMVNDTMVMGPSQISLMTVGNGNTYGATQFRFKLLQDGSVWLHVDQDASLAAAWAEVLIMGIHTASE